MNNKGLHFRETKLYKNNRQTKYEVVLDTQIEDMWRVKYPDGTISADYYNLTRSKEHCYRLLLRLKRYDDFEGEDTI